MSDSLLEVALRHRAGALTLDVSFKLHAPWTVLFGASGSGKSTILRLIQGSVRPQEGRIALRGVAVVDTERGRFVAPHLRAIRSAGQMARLFPAMKVLRNVSWGSAWLSKPRDTEDLAMHLLKLFRIGHLASEWPARLSGGERQRVSVARAVLSAVTSGSLLLLDEPFTGLEFALRDELALDLREFLAESQVPVLSVTHDVGEAFLLEAEVVRLAEGRVVAQGTAREGLGEERERLLGQLQLTGGNAP